MAFLGEAGRNLLVTFLSTWQSTLFGIIHCTSGYELGAFSQYNSDCPNNEAMSGSAL